MNETNILIGGGTLLVVALILSLLSNGMERMGDARVSNAPGCALNGLLMLIAVPLMILAGFGVILAGLYVIRVYGG